MGSNIWSDHVLQWEGYEKGARRDLGANGKESRSDAEKPRGDAERPRGDAEKPRGDGLGAPKNAQIETLRENFQEIDKRNFLAWRT